jgi:hypothetical protein
MLLGSKSWLVWFVTGYMPKFVIVSLTHAYTHCRVRRTDTHL